MQLKNLTTYIFLLLIFSIAPGFVAAQDDPTRPVEAGPGGKIKLEPKFRTRAETLYEWHAHASWESRYVTEGRDNLSGDGIVSLSSEFVIDNLSIIPWIADSPGTDYSEFNLNIVYGFKLNDQLDIYTGYNHIQAREAGVSSNDNELSVDLAYKIRKRLNLLASVYHSFDAEGSFMELAVSSGFPLQQKKIKLGVKAILGANAGYIADGHRGLNHMQVRLNLAYQPQDAIDLNTFVGYNLAINRDEDRYSGDELLRDFFWAGLGLAYRF